MHCPSPYHEKKESEVLYSSSEKKDTKLDVKCTSKTHNKPTLYKCGSCNLIFSEHIKRSFEEDYSKVEDNKYIEQIYPIRMEVRKKLAKGNIREYCSAETGKWEWQEVE